MNNTPQTVPEVPEPGQRFLFNISGTWFEGEVTSLISDNRVCRVHMLLGGRMSVTWSVWKAKGWIRPIPYCLDIQAEIRDRPPVEFNRSTCQVPSLPRDNSWNCEAA